LIIVLLEAQWMEAFTILEFSPSLRRSRRKTVAFFAASQHKDLEFERSRRNFLFQTSTLFIVTSTPRAAQASGLVKFPCTKPLGNTYHFMRVGETLLEEQDIWSTNPLFL
jgi:hypothetical protein